MKNQPISRVMTPEPVTVTSSDSIAAAERSMRERRCHHVPVVDENSRVVGMISARDLLKALVLDSGSDAALKQGALQRKRAADAMRRDVVVLSQTATVLDAAKALATGNIHALPVVAPGDVLVGIVTSSDLIETLADALEHPVTERTEAAPDEHDESGEQVRLLREVYRATIRYLESGRAEMEHSRLLRAVGRARERIAQADLPI